jgi:hypothetical protein
MEVEGGEVENIEHKEEYVNSMRVYCDITSTPNLYLTPR